MENVDKIEKLLKTGNDIKNGIKEYRATKNSIGVDHDVSFNGDCRFSSAKINISIDSFSTPLRIPVDDIFEKHFIAELNSRFDDIMNNVADRIIKEAEKYQQEAEKELVDKLEKIRVLTKKEKEVGE